MGLPLLGSLMTCVARWRTRHGATRVAAILAAAATMSACGGGLDASDTVTSAASLASNDRATAAPADTTRAGASNAVVARLPFPRTPADVAEPAGAYEMRLFDHNDWPRETFELVPVRGVGYQTVRAAVVLRGSKTLSPVAGVQPYCATALRCEYLPPRSAGHAERYTVSLPDESIARLSTSEGLIVISARFLDVERPSTVSVTLTVDGQAPVTKRITYMKSSG